MQNTDLKNPVAVLVNAVEQHLGSKVHVVVGGTVLMLYGPVNKS